MCTIPGHMIDRSLDLPNVVDLWSVFKPCDLCAMPTATTGKASHTQANVDVDDGGEEKADYAKRTRQ